ncbi:class I SAM-dependent methyltransferase [Paenibacillus sp. MWE-103]|uniref:Class I SAM-dependent methyltransferase n=1 Tax=Paenibacillus artemisiicola TaxID=1172618 RepID=A0ABS3W4W0_9BACL|nr:class I SAM-dependent methyltransferase [Paenibacillus artemisiicola]
MIPLLTEDPARLFDDMLSLTAELFFERERASLLDGHMREAESVLDIGCGNGAYLEAVKRAYPRLRCTGIEKDARVYPFAAARSAPGLSFVQADYKDAAAGGEPFDVVVIRLAALHLPDFRHFLAWLRGVTHERSAILILDLDDAATGPLPGEELPLFDALLRASRKPLLARFPKPPREALAELAQAEGWIADPQSYRILADEPRTKRRMYRYMETSTRILQGGRLDHDRKKELDDWLSKESASYSAGMFALTLRRDRY